MEGDATTLDPFGRPCHWTTCASVEKTALRDLMLRACSCSRSVHVACLANMLQNFHAPQGFDVAVCSKNCYDRIQMNSHGEQGAGVSAASQSQPTTPLRWNNDGPSPDVCSLSVLLEWLTTGGNYKRLCSCVTLEEKALIGQEVVKAMAARDLRTKRQPADILKAITILEKSYKAAQDWLKANEHEPIDVNTRRAGMLKRCVHYDALHPVMWKQEGNAVSPPHAARTISMDSAEDNGKKDAEAVTREATHQHRPSKKQRTATTSAKVAPKPPALVVDTSVAASQPKQALAAREAEARIQESLAHASKLRQEEHFMSLQAAVMLLRERLKLRQEGVAQDDIDLYLPLYPNAQI